MPPEVLARILKKMLVYKDVPCDSLKEASAYVVRKGPIPPKMLWFPMGKAVP